MTSGEPALSRLLSTSIHELVHEIALARLAPGYLYLPGLFRLANLLEGIAETRLIVGNLIQGETLEQIAQRCHRLEPVHEAAESRRHVTRPQARQLVMATAEGFRRSLELMEQTELNRLGGLGILELLIRKRLQVRVHIHGTIGLRAYLFEQGGDRNPGNQAGLISGENLLLPGGFSPTECTLHISGQQSCGESVRWFDRLWDEAVDASELLVEEIRRSWVYLRSHSRPD